MAWVGPPFGQQYDLQSIRGQLLTPRDWSLDFARLQSINTDLVTLSRLIRWGRGIAPVWTYGAVISAPPANSALVSITVFTGKSGYIYGFFISTSENNVFKINWTSGGVAQSIQLQIGAGTVIFFDFCALNEGKPADAGISQRELKASLCSHLVIVFLLT